MNIIKASDFDINKYSLVVMPTDNNSPQHVFLPMYNYATTNNGIANNDKISRLLFLTKPMNVNNGIERISQFHPTDNDCLYFWINENYEHGGNQELFERVIDPIDNLHKAKINTQGNKDFIIKINDKGVAVPLAKLRYDTIVKSKPMGNEDDDYKPQPVVKRIKVRLDTFYEPDINHNTPRKIKTAVFIPVDTSVPVNQRVFKSHPEPINCLDDVRKLFSWGCTAQYTLQVSKFWAQKALGNGQKMCGNIVKCLQIFVLDNPAWNKKIQFTNNTVPIGLGLKVAVVGQAQVPNVYAKKACAKYEESDSESEDEEEVENAPIKKLCAKK